MEARYTHLISETPFNDKRFMYHYVSDKINDVYQKQKEFREEAKKRGMEGVGLITTVEDTAQLPKNAFVSGASYTLIPDIGMYLDKYKEQLEETGRHLMI